MISNKVADSSKHPKPANRTQLSQILEEFSMEEYGCQAPRDWDADTIAPPIKKIGIWNGFVNIGGYKINPATASGTLLQTNT